MRFQTPSNQKKKKNLNYDPTIHSKSIRGLVLNPSFMFQGKRVALQVLNLVNMSKIELFLGIEMAKGVMIRVNDELLRQ